MIIMKSWFFAIIEEKNKNKKSFRAVNIDIKPFSVYFIVEIKKKSRKVLTKLKVGGIIGSR